MSYYFLLGVVGCLVLCMYEYRRRLKRLTEDYMDTDRIVFLHLERIKARMNDLEKEIEDRFRWKDSGVPVDSED